MRPVPGYCQSCSPPAASNACDGARHAVREKPAVGEGRRRLRTRAVPRGRRVHVERRRVARPPDRLAGRRVERGHHLVLALAAEQVQAVADQHRAGVAESDVYRPVPLQRVRPARRHVEGSGHAVTRRPAPLGPVLRRRVREDAEYQRQNRCRHESAREVSHRCLLQILIRGFAPESAPIVRAIDLRREGPVTWRSRRIVAATGLPLDSVANVSRIVALDRNLLDERAGGLPPARLELLLVRCTTSSSAVDRRCRQRRVRSYSLRITTHGVLNSATSVDQPAHSRAAPISERVRDVGVRAFLDMGSGRSAQKCVDRHLRVRLVRGGLVLSGYECLPEEEPVPGTLERRPIQEGVDASRSLTNPVQDPGDLRQSCHEGRGSRRSCEGAIALTIARLCQFCRFISDRYPQRTFEAERDLLSGCEPLGDKIRKRFDIATARLLRVGFDRQAGPAEPSLSDGPDVRATDGERVGDREAGLRIEIVLSRLVDDAKLMVFRSVGIREQPVVLAAIQRGLVTGVAGADDEVRTGHALLYIPLDLEFKPAPAVRFVPMKFRVARHAVGQRNIGVTLAFPPTCRVRRFDGVGRSHGCRGRERWFPASESHRRLRSAWLDKMRSRVRNPDSGCGFRQDARVDPLPGPSRGCRVAGRSQPGRLEDRPQPVQNHGTVAVSRETEGGR